MTTLKEFNDNYRSNLNSEYCNSVIDCTDSEGNLSYPNVMQLLGDHGQSYYEYAEDCGHDYHANTILSWLGY